MQSRPDEVHWVSIDGLRRDATLAGRGMFVAVLVPMMGLLHFLMALLENLPRVEWAVLADPRPWLLLAFTVAVVVGLRFLGGSFAAAGLRFIIATLVAIPLAALGYGIWSMSSVDWSRLATLPPGWEMLLVVVPLMLALSAALLWWIILAPAAGAWRLLRAKIGPGERPFPEVMAHAARHLARDGAPVSYSRAGTASRLLGALAILLGLVATVVVIWMLSQRWYVSALSLEFAAIYLITLLVRRARMSAAVSAEQLRLEDMRPPILYLRAFQDDATLMQAEWDVAMLSGSGSLSRSSRVDSAWARLWRRYSVGLLSTSGRLEDAIAGDVRALGPFVAIGDPTEPLPKLGAARAYYDNDTWRGAILRWIDMAQLIVKVAGPTRTVRWELDNIIARGALSKLVILMAPVSAQERTERWRNMMAELADTPWAPALAKVDPVTLVGLRFPDSGSMLVVAGGKGRMIDYQIGLRILLALPGRPAAASRA